MKLIDALLAVDRSPENTYDANFQAIARSLDIDRWSAPEDFDDRVRAHYLVKWYCTDTWVGIQAIYMDGELVCVTKQYGRKSDIDVEWVSKQAAYAAYEWLRPQLEVDLIGDVEIGETYGVTYVSQLLHDHALYDGVEVTIVRDDLYKRNRNSYKFDGDGQDVTIQFADQTTKQVHVSKLQFKLALAKG